MNDFTLVGTRVVDLSTRGAMIACDEQMEVGQELMISLRTPWLGPYVVMLGEVRRVVEGWREGDPGYCVGVRFLETEDDAEIRRELTRRLAPFPLVPEQRRYRPDYAESVRRIHLGY